MKWKSSYLMWIFIVAPMVLLGLGFIYIGATTPANDTDDAGSSFSGDFYLMGGAFTVFPILIGLFISWVTGEVTGGDSDLLKKGVWGEAEILKREQTGWFVNDQPQVKFLLKVTLPGIAPYQIEHNEIVNMIDVGLINPGAVVPVVVDSKNPGKMSLLYDEVVAKPELKH